MLSICLTRCSSKLRKLRNKLKGFNVFRNVCKKINEIRFKRQSNALFERKYKTVKLTSSSPFTKSFQKCDFISWSNLHLKTLNSEEVMQFLQAYKALNYRISKSIIMALNGKGSIGPTTYGQCRDYRGRLRYSKCCVYNGMNYSYYFSSLTIKMTLAGCCENDGQVKYVEKLSGKCSHDHGRPGRGL